MIRIIIGILIGAGALYLYQNSDTKDEIIAKAKASVHSAAVEVADATAEPSILDRAKNIFK
jgi:hypothetical protein